MGEEAPAGHWTLRTSLPHPARVRLLRDGREVGTGLEQRVEEPGVYRVEAYRDDRTWVISNPIYIR
jgi:hypothetical protein